MSCSKNYPKDPKLQIENFTIELEVEILIGIEFLRRTFLVYSFVSTYECVYYNFWPIREPIKFRASDLFEDSKKCQLP